MNILMLYTIWSLDPLKIIFHKEKTNVLSFLKKYINSIMNQYLMLKIPNSCLGLWLYSLSVLRSQDSELCADFCQERNRGHHYGEGVKPDPGRLHFSDHLQVLVGLLCVVIDVDRDHTLVFSWFFCRKQTKILSSMTDKCIG